MSVSTLRWYQDFKDTPASNVPVLMTSAVLVGIGLESGRHLGRVGVVADRAGHAGRAV
jgi:hypothetical protein